ncbi:hypothetical protein ACFFHJ_25190 [Planotetraspora thailandica]|uniref:hypothetical protein n=1 Tax=Planotetraspora thailandica TaxID=487172 RepID=UPI00195027AD|nr:hypothetical protein [Planotetraspora thailandica]
MLHVPQIKDFRISVSLRFSGTFTIGVEGEEVSINSDAVDSIRMTTEPLQRSQVDLSSSAIAALGHRERVDGTVASAGVV